MQLDAKYMNQMFRLADRLPPEIIYAAALRLMVYSTTGKYSDTEVPALPAVEALNRWMQDKIVPYKVLAQEEKKSE